MPGINVDLNCLRKEEESGGNGNNCHEGHQGGRQGQGQGGDEGNEISRCWTSLLFKKFIVGIFVSIAVSKLILLVIGSIAEMIN